MKDKSLNIIEDLKLNHRRDRLIRKISTLEEMHKGDELNYTYWGGFDLGYLKGKLSVIEDLFDEFL